MSDIEDKMLKQAWKLFSDPNKRISPSYTEEIWAVQQLDEHIFQYNTGYQYKDGSFEGSNCNIVWFENGKLTPLKTIPLRRGFAIGPYGPMLENYGNGLYATSRVETIQYGYDDYRSHTEKDGNLVRVSAEGFEEIKDDLSNLSEQDFLRLYDELATLKYHRYREALKERTFDLTGKWGDPKASLTQRLEQYSKLVYGSYPEEYKWLQQSLEEKAELIEIMNHGNKETAQLAVQAYDTSHLSGLLQVAVDAPNTPALELISARYRETHDDKLVDSIIERADEIVKLPYKQMLFERITRDNTNDPEANFLDEFTDRIRDLAMNKYGQEDWYTSISEAGKNPEFMKEADQVWETMFAEADKYATFRPNNHDNAYIRQMFPNKAAQLHEYVTAKPNDFARTLDEAIKYHQTVGKMQAAIREYCHDNHVDLNGNLHFDLVDAGIESKKEAKRCLDIWQKANERPDRYGSPYNKYSIAQIAQVAKSKVMQDWMYPVMMDAVEKGALKITDERMPSERTLFDCCKAWKICPSMPQRLAKEVGTYSLRGRMLAGAIFEQMCEQGNTKPSEWRENKELHQKFYEELNRAQKMPKDKAFKQYLPNTAVNRKRLIAMGMEEKGIENTPDNFKKLYKLAKEQGTFEKMLAKPGEQKTTFSSKLMVDAARLKNAKRTR